MNFIRDAYLIAMRHRFEYVGTSNLSLSRISSETHPLRVRRLCLDFLSFLLSRVNIEVWEIGRDLYFEQSVKLRERFEKPLYCIHSIL